LFCFFRAKLEASECVLASVYLKLDHCEGGFVVRPVGFSVFIVRERERVNEACVRVGWLIVRVRGL
jgi:hypothetical protein